MGSNPALGVMIFALGGLAGAVFYLPFKKVKNWAWESYWMIYAVAGLIVVPWVLAFSTSPNVRAVLRHSPPRTLAYCFACGAMWGVGGFTWGLMIRYLGVGLGLAIGCGLCSASGTLIPPILAGNLASLADTPAVKAALAGVVVSLLGIVLVGMAGMSKENELPEEEKKKAVAEYNFRKGILVAIFSGLMSSAMSFGLQGGPITAYKAQFGSQTRVLEAEDHVQAQVPEQLAGLAGVFYDKEGKVWVAPAAAPHEVTTSKTWRGMPILVVVLAGGFVINFLYCFYLNIRNKTLGDYARKDAPLAGNTFFAALAGAIWCCQFICFKTGEPAMGQRAYIGWAVLMASAILFSTLLGILLGEWKGTSSRTRTRLAAGLVLLILSSVIAGYSGYLKAA
ncbi:MAG TPA: L-rhamnose/proton symporter RhaT [Phycisphaerae bacterium]|nr:L-rhamnose/proton symporter RhaT [Phycisphaerae bacterium]